ncbi:MAG: hypothetical protein ACYC6L_04785 [Anaerolineae bacterium]
MQTISTTLAAAAAQWGSQPYIRLDVRDERPRWRQIRSGSSAGQVSQIVVGLSYLLRARVTADGLGIVRVFEPDKGDAAWTTWDHQHSLPLANSDVAVTVVGPYNTSTNCRACFLSASGGDADLLVTSSADGFSTPVATAATIASGLSQAGWLGAADSCVFYGANGSAVRVWHKTWTGASWTEGAPWPGGTMGACYGIAACWDPQTSRAVVLAAADGAILAARYDPAGDAWSDLIQLAPGGTASAGTAASYRLPSVCYAADRVVAAWVEALDVASLRTQAVSCEAEVFPHFGSETALDLEGGASLGRPNLAYYWTSLQVYAADEGSACLRTRVSDEAGPALRLDGLEPSVYRLHSDDAGSRMVLRLANPDGLYDRPGEAGSPAEAIKVHSTLLVRRGYLTSAGAESITLAPHYILEARLVSGEGGGWLELESSDGRALLAGWQAGEALSWENRSIRWLLAELCARAGLGYSDNEAAVLGNILARYTLGLGTNALQGVVELLRLGASVARMASWGLYALPVADWAAAGPAEFGAQSEILREEHRQAAPEATMRLVYGSGADGWSEDAAGAMALGTRRVRARVDERITSADWAASMAQAEQALDALAARRALLTVPLRTEIEQWDPALAEGEAGRITAIDERWEAASGRYETTAELAIE